MRAQHRGAQERAVDTWLYRLSTDGTTLLDPRLPWELLTDDERARADKIELSSVNGELLAKRFCFRRAIVRSVLARELDARAQALEFDRRCRLCGHPTHGKPQLVGYPDIDFSCAYRDEVIAIAISAAGFVGIDVEQIDGVDAGEVDALAATLFTDHDRPYWPPPEAASNEERVVAFCRAFVAKEARGKLVGRGLVGDSPEAPGITLDWLPAPPSYLAAVAFSPREPATH